MSKKESIEPTNPDGELHGLCIWYHPNGNIDYKRRYSNGKSNGICESYRSNGKLLYKEYWLKGKYVYEELYGSLNEIRFSI